MHKRLKFRGRSYQLVEPVVAKTGNTPTQPELWQRVLRLTQGLQQSLTHNGITIEAPNEGRGFRKYPSAYASGWAVQTYRKLGGRWKSESDLDEWFSGHGGGSAHKAHPKGDWVAIAPRSMEIDGKRYEKGDILGPCGISSEEKFRKYTENGQEPFKCMPRKKAYQLGPEERGRSASRKSKEQKKQPHGQKPVRVKT